MLGYTEEEGGPLVRVAVPRAVAVVVEEAGRASPSIRMARNGMSPTLPRQHRRRVRGVKEFVHVSICACHPCAGAMLFFSVPFQFYRMIPEGNPPSRLSVAHVCVVRACAARSKSFNNPTRTACVWKKCHLVLVFDEGPLARRAPRPTLRAKERSLWATGGA